MKLSKYAKGQMAVVFTLVLATMMGVMALGTDIGVMYYQWAQLQKGADAASLAGASFLNGGQTFYNVNSNCTSQSDDAKKAACTYAINNGLAYDASSLTINEPGVNLPAGARTPNLQVIVTKTNQPYYFARLIGLTTYNVGATATAAQAPVSQTNGLFPMGVQCNSPCTTINLQPAAPVSFNQKFSPTGNASGNWQWLTDGAGAPSVANAITNGMSGSYSVNGTVTTETGNIANSGLIKNAFSARFLANNCSSISDPCVSGSTVTIPATDPCVVTVPAVDFVGANGKSQLTVEAFAQVYIEPGSTASNISACFVKQLDVNALASSGSAPNLGSLGPVTLIQ